MSVTQIHARMVVAVKIKMMDILVNARKVLLELIVKQVCGSKIYMVDFKLVWSLKQLHTFSVCIKTVKCPRDMVNKSSISYIQL